MSEQQPSRINVLVGVSGSVAAIKVPEIVTGISRFANVRVVCTENARHFVDFEESLRDAFGNPISVYKDADEWNSFQKRGDPVLHIELRKWADLLVIAPLSANTLAKIQNGICDNLLTSIARAWNFEKPFIVAPAMNTLMWEHPCTSSHIQKLREWGIKVVPPISKTLMCGDKGLGAMALPETIIEAIRAENLL